MRLNIFILIVTIVLIVACTVQEPPKEEPITTGTQAETSADQAVDAVTEASPRIPLEELEKHNSIDNCWVGYEGKVYDITSFFGQHSEKMAVFCGTAAEFSDAMRGVHGQSKDQKIEEIGTYIGYLQ
ncbi:MAG: hypothetical protein KJ601_04500 [Nanoarchaeota archaeon]|nr:hypothetical protein [Nanoarchaeota archaeon]MBU1703845.1 hypothetical protein [Nanoarchaeota archaeon]